MLVDTARKDFHAEADTAIAKATGQTVFSREKHGST